MNPDSAQKRIAFGYNRNALGKIVINEGQAATVQLIFCYYIDGLSIAKIKENLERMSIPSPLNGGKWGKQTIANILSNTHYLGDEIYPAIISKDRFDTSQMLKQKNVGNNGYGKKHNRDTGKTDSTLGVKPT